MTRKYVPKGLEWLKNGLVNYKRYIYYVVVGLAVAILAVCLFCFRNNVNKNIQELNNSVQVTVQENSELQQTIAQIEAEKAELQNQLNIKQNEVNDLNYKLSLRQTYYGVGGVSSSAGNFYAYGFCTWYVKNMRPDIPNNWGNAWGWYWNAQAIGWPTGTTPQQGAIGVAKNYGHVVYVLDVYSDSILLSEMNWAGWNVVNTRTAPISEFTYIY